MQSHYFMELSEGPEISERMRKSEALERLASIKLIELSNEAKVEYCRASRDLRICGRYVQHVLNSCTHATLCDECIHRYDHCPVCKIPVPKSGTKCRDRLYDKLVQSGLISKGHDDRFQEKDNTLKQLTPDIRRLYSFFDVASENNLISLVCHYIIEVCMDENAVSSDPTLSFLLDAVLVKDWCIYTFEKIVDDLCDIYNCGFEGMSQNLATLLLLSTKLSALSTVLDVLESSFRGTTSVQLHDLYSLLENVTKVKQHLEIMLWCIRHQFLENVPLQHVDLASWHSLVCERKSSAIKRSWPSFTSRSMESSECIEPSLFIEDALVHLGIDYETQEKGCTALCLHKFLCLPRSFKSMIADTHGCCYPFEDVRTACGVLFLYGTSDLVIAKRSTFLYYIFDRQWTTPDANWRYLIDDFALTFDINRHSLLESLTFYLLDDHSEQALQEACHLLPEIVTPGIHPKIAQVLLERQRPDAALTVLRCSRGDGLSCSMSSEKDDAQPVSLGEAVTAIRVRMECGLLTEAFMYQRTHYEKLERWERDHAQESFDRLKYQKIRNEHVEALVTEICRLCIRRNLLDRMIEFPWSPSEEKYLHSCLLNNAATEPGTNSGSLLVVFYLQRYRYVEAYQVHHQLQKLEQDILSRDISEEVISRITVTSQFRARIVDKCVKLLPDVQQEQLRPGDLPEFDHLPVSEVHASTGFFTGVQEATPASQQSVILMKSSVPNTSSSDSNNQPASKSGSLFSYDLPFVLHRDVGSNGKFFPKTKMDQLSSGIGFHAARESGTKQGGASSVRSRHPLGSQVIPLKEVRESVLGGAVGRGFSDNAGFSSQNLLYKMQLSESSHISDIVQPAVSPSQVVSGKGLLPDRCRNTIHVEEAIKVDWSEGSRWRSDDTSDSEGDEDALPKILSSASSASARVKSIKRSVRVQRR